jgi:DNA-binding MarR family transcriptional regulator
LDQKESEGPEQADDAARTIGAAPRLFTFRLVGVLNMLRRSATLATRREFGLLDTEWRIMAQVGENAPLSLNALAEPLGLDRGQLSRAVKGMVTRGLLDSRRKRGGPAIVITLSEEGRALYERMMVLAAARNAFLVGDIPEAEIERVAAVLDAVMGKAQLLLERERAFQNEASGRTD